jgi:hypothetical protein
MEMLFPLSQEVTCHIRLTGGEVGPEQIAFLRRYVELHIEALEHDEKQRAATMDGPRTLTAEQPGCDQEVRDGGSASG